MLKKDYLAKLSHALNYIEAHLHEPISLSEISAVAFSSLSHFHRIFFFMTGMTLKDYIRRRRMSFASERLMNSNDKIIDIALLCCYDTPESFSRAFKECFALTPREFREMKRECELFTPIDIEQIEATQQYTDLIPVLNYVVLRGMQVAGLSLRTTLCQHQQATQIPQFFAEVMSHQKLDPVPFKTEPLALLGVYTDMTDDESFTYTLACEIEKSFAKQAQFVEHHLPPGKYARFTASCPPSELEKAWQYIYGKWMPNSGDARARGFDFEIYNPDVTEIYIPLL